MTRSAKPEWYDRSFGYILAVYAAELIGLAAAIFALARLASLPLERAFLIVFGAFTVAGAYWKPWWYWEHRGGWLARRALGDRVARAVFIIMGIGLLYLGLFSDLAMR